MTLPYDDNDIGKPQMQFYIVSFLNWKVLNIAGSNLSEGAKVITHEKNKPASKNQLWYLDLNGHIRSALNDFVPQANDIGQQVTMHSFNDISYQQWRFDGSRIKNGATGCLTIEGSNLDDGANIIASPYSGAQNQRWWAEFVRFYIVSELNGKVMNIQGNDASEGAKVIMYEKKHPAPENQLWYIDESAVIRSALNQFALSGDGIGHHVQMHPYNGGRHQEWWFQGQKITNGSGKYLDIEGSNKSNEANVISNSHKGSANQLWRAEIV